MAAVEGATAPTAAWQATVMRSNRTQIFTSTAQASGTADVVEKYGRAQELAYQLSMRASELKRNLEYAFVGVGSGQAVVTGNDTTARQMNGYQAQIATATQVNASAGVLTEAMVLSAAQACYINGADPDTLMIKPVDGTKIAQWQYNSVAGGNRYKVADQKDKSIVNVVDIYESPYGSLRVVMNRFLHGANTTASDGINDTTSDTLVFEASMWKKCVLRNWFRQTLAKTGDSTQVQILGEFSLKHLNQKASGLIYGGSVS